MPVCIPTNSVLGFPFLHNLASTCCLLICLLWPVWLVWSSISLWCQFASFPWLVMLSILSYVYRPSVLLGEVSVQVLGLFFNFIFLVWSRVSSVYILEIKLLSKVSLANIFSHMVASLFILLKIPETPIQKNLCTPMVISAQFTIAKCLKQPKCPSVNEWNYAFIYLLSIFFIYCEFHEFQD